MAKSNLSTEALSSQSQELRQQVNNGQALKPAVVIGKVVLKPGIKQIPQPGRGAPRPPPAAGPVVQKRLKRADDRQTQQAGNQAMLQELQFIKGKLRASEEKLRASEEKLAATTADAIFFRIQLGALIEQLLAAGSSVVLPIVADPVFQALADYVKTKA